ncbi:hypothetical protein [Pediococcus damnosus]|uniref:Type I restriction-modification system, restriction subunit R n=1 Tax=Pediococcus damnosus TaxID=51663 RepID=A0AAC9B416_9LACO|nr:hypothetical protein [Pediococcus damnosus]AMV63974.1 Type I restriction-modification system, restriction subunit R [Pediococcus damnosus]
MSRTNRTIDKTAKPHGKVRFYRQGAVMEEKVKDALVIYTKGGNDTLADAGNTPDDQEQKDLFDEGILAPKAADKIVRLEPPNQAFTAISG